MSDGIYGSNADLAQRLKDRIAYHANEHRHTYEVGKGVMDALALDRGDEYLELLIPDVIREMAMAARYDGRRATAK